MGRDRLTKHHRRCKSNGGGNEPENISMVKRELHQAYHLIFQNKPPERMAELLNELWIDPRYEMVAHKRR